MQSVKWCPASELVCADFVAFVVQHQLAPSHFDCFDIHFVPDLIKTPFPNRSYQIHAFPYRQHVLLFRRLTDWLWWANSLIQMCDCNYRRYNQSTYTTAYAHATEICVIWEFSLEHKIEFRQSKDKNISTNTMCVLALRFDQVVIGFYNSHCHNSHF